MSDVTPEGTEVTRFWFQPRSGSADDLASRVKAAGHLHVVVRGGLVGLVPFELVKDAWGWVRRMQNHFQADFVKSE